LLGSENPQQLSQNPLRCALFDNMVLMELVKARNNCGLDHNKYFCWDSHLNEIDIIFRSGYLLIPVEIKSVQRFNTKFLKGLNYLDKIFSNQVKTGYIVYNRQIEQKIGRFEILNFRKIHQIVLV
jgi:predicted AAA+ superfamily ATPase